MYKVLLVDDHKIIRDGIINYFEGDAEFVFTEIENGTKAFELLQNCSFDLVLSDLSMPEMDGIELTEKIKGQNKDQKVLILTMLSEVHHIKKLMSLGVEGYILKSCSATEIITAVKRVLKGDNYYAEAVTSAIMDGLAGRQIKPKERLTVTTQLSKREIEVLKLIVDEFNNQEIADKLFISTRTVDGHKRNLLQKTGCKNVAGLVMYAIENNIQ
ncbi:MAG: DNA-binding NarL/FixJ family response regulator [Cyclobacteriaceae bacterium]|jgi:NarL family two-component system response regulator LiaR